MSVFLDIMREAERLWDSHVDESFVISDLMDALDDRSFALFVKEHETFDELSNYAPWSVENIEKYEEQILELVPR